MGGQTTVIIGGGASGMTAALSAWRKGDSVILLERMPRLGKKILATGNGRCNLANEHLDAVYYRPEARIHARTVFSRFGRDDIKHFFKGLGLLMQAEEDGRIFPATNQAATVVRILEIALTRSSVDIRTGFDVSKITKDCGLFIVSSKSGESVRGTAVIIAGGGAAYPALGSNGSAFTLSEKMGHTIILPVPGDVPLVSRDPLCVSLQGQRITGNVKAFAGKRMLAESRGDLQFAKYGLTGTAILDISTEVSAAINRMHAHDVSVELDMAPFITREELKKLIYHRILENFPIEELLAGVVPDKFNRALSALFKKKEAGAVAEAVKSKRVSIIGTRGWNEADFTVGGVSLDEVDPQTLGSKKAGGIYFCGEVLDVVGRRGGYNLAWAWASGFIAGLTGRER